MDFCFLPTAAMQPVSQRTEVIVVDGRPPLRRSIALAYVLWAFFGFLGVHRFYLERPVTGVIWLLTLGIAGVGWVIDVFLIPGMVSQAPASDVPVRRGRACYDSVDVDVLVGCD